MRGLPEGSIILCPVCKRELYKTRNDLPMMSKIGAECFEPIGDEAILKPYEMALSSCHSASWLLNGSLFVKGLGWYPSDPFRKARFTESQAELELRKHFVVPK